MNVWIDLDNSPHVPFFAPIIRELERRGHRIALTARDAYQVCELANLFGLSYKRVGRHYGKHKLLKFYGTCVRAAQLFPTAWKGSPDIAVSHGSRSQMLAAATKRIPSIVILDYEHARHLAFLNSVWIMAPNMIPSSAIRHNRSRVLRYPGIKEDVYVGGFHPDPRIRAQLGVSDDSILAVLRPPATEAHYHNAESDDLFYAAMDHLADTPNVTTVLLPRNRRQRESVRKARPHLLSAKKVIIPEQPVDGLNLIWNSDFVISGGGTMNREAAALGVPVYSIFRGQIGAVDRYLAEMGRLELLQSPEELRSKIVPTRRVRPAGPPSTAGNALTAIVDNITNVLDSKC